MYKLIIADDEKIIRTGLKESINWEELGFEIQAVLSDGEEIIEYMEYSVPDVILTDIKMSNVSGLDVARYVSSHKLPCRVFLISGFSEFQLALEAIKYGAENYFLKPINLDEIKKTFVSVRERLDEEKKKAEISNQERENLTELRDILEEQFFEELIFGAISDRGYIGKKIRILYPQLSAEEAECIVFNINFVDFEYFIYNTWEYNYDQFEENLMNFLKLYDGEYLFRIIFMNENTMKLLAIHCAAHDSNQYTEEIEDYIEKIVKDIEGVFLLKASYEVFGVYRNIYELEAQRNQVLVTAGHYSDINKIQVNEQIHMVVSHLVAGNYSKARNVCHSIIEREYGYADGKANREVYAILSNLSKALGEMNQSLGFMLSSYIKEEVILSLPDKDAVHEYCNRFFDYLRMSKNKEGDDLDNLVQRAKKYIGDNIYRDISREEVAKKLFISPSYLSKLFVKETGETYLRYVNRRKIEKAIELLNKPEYRSYQIGEKLGYSSAKYFTRLFKAQTGMTPSEYRRKILSVSGIDDEE